MFVYLKIKVTVVVPYPVSTQVEFGCSFVFVAPGGLSVRIGGFRRKDALRDCTQLGSRRKKEGHKLYTQAFSYTFNSLFNLGLSIFFRAFIHSTNYKEGGNGRRQFESNMRGIWCPTTNSVLVEDKERRAY